MENFVENLKQVLLDTLPDDEEKHYTNSGLDDDSSSGYESTDLDFSDGDLDDKIHAPERRHVKTPGQLAARVKSTNVLCEKLKLIIDMPEMCDVTFLVGPEMVPVYGVRAILGTRSKVLYQLIINHMSMRSHHGNKKTKQQHSCTDCLEIPVKKYTPEVFRILIQFIHCGMAKLSDTNVFGLLCGAYQFELTDLQKACWQYVDRRLQHGHSEHILESCKHHLHHAVAQDIADEISARSSRRNQISAMNHCVF